MFKSSNSLLVRFDKHRKFLDQWMFDITNKIDSLEKVLNNQDSKIAAIAYRKEEHEERITKLQTSAARILPPPLPLQTPVYSIKLNTSLKAKLTHG